jgi:VWFA-related protein
MTRQPILSAAALACALLTAGRDVLPAAAQIQTPPRTLAAGSATISVDFLALGRDGLPVLDLKPEEVQLRVDGKSRVLRSLTLMSVGEGSDTSSRPTSEPPPAPFATNNVSDGGRAFVLMIDDETLKVGNEQPLRSAVSHFLTGLSSRDRVAVVTVPHGGLKVDFTGDRSRVRQALSAITGHANDRETATDAAVRTRTTLQQITGWLENLGGGQGPTTVVLFSSSLMGVRGTMAQISRATAAGESVGMGQIRQEEFQYVGEAAAKARAQFYVVQHDQMISSAPAVATALTSSDSNSVRAGLENLTGVTGGPIFSLAGAGGDTALTRIARETTAHWVATFDAEPGERNDIYHLLSVRVSRSGVSVRARPTLPIAKPDASASRPSPTTPHAMLIESRVYRELGLRLVGFASRYRDGQIQVVAVAETLDPSVSFATAEAALFDDSGHMLRQWTPRPTDLGTNRIIGAFSGMPRGHYRLKFAATNAAGHRGVVECDIAAELAPAGAMKLSDIVLGLSRDDRFTPRLQFGSEPVALAYLDMYGGQAGAKISVMIEVAQTLNGPAFLAVQPAVDATNEPDRFNVTAAIPIGALPAGDYVIRATVALEGQPEGRTVRTLRKVGQ